MTDPVMISHPDQLIAPSLLADLADARARTSRAPLKVPPRPETQSPRTRGRSREFACPIRDVLDRIGDAWSLSVMMELARGPCRFNALRRVIDGISQRMLAVTLRHLERDGLVHRSVLPLSPPQVDYALTPLGESLIGRVALLHLWAVEHQPQVRAARAVYDSRAA